MFKRTKKLSPPPASPTISEILDDLETFQVDKQILVKTRQIDPTSTKPEAEWWKAFETFLQDVQDFKRMRTEINGYKIKLESSKLEIDAAAKNIENEIATHLDKARSEIKD